VFLKPEVTICIEEHGAPAASRTPYYPATAAIPQVCQRTRFKSIAHRKLRQCRLTEIGSVEIHW